MRHATVCLLQAVLVTTLLAVQIQCNPNFSRQGRFLAQAKKCDATTFNPIKPSVLKSSLRDIIWEGLDDQHVFALTKAFSNIHEDGVWRSTDGGSNFVDISDHFKAPAGDDSVVYKLMAQKSKPNNMLFIGTGPVIWTSSDYGETAVAVKTPGEWTAALTTYRVHPYHDDWILALVRRKECRSANPAACAYDLFLTQNAYSGLTWQNLTANTRGGIAGFVDFDWGANLCPDNDCTSDMKFDERRIFATMFLHPGDLDQDWDPDVIFTYSDDFFKSHQLNIKCGNQFEILGRSIYLALANSCPTDIHGKPRKDDTGYPQGISLYTSVDAGKSFTQACLPAALKQSSYELTETHDRRGAVAIVDYVAKTTDYFQITTSSVYVAGPHHAIFSLSLTNVFKDPFGITADFSKVEGIPGVYIANEMVSRYGEELDLTDRTDNFVVTKITFNGGGGWRQIRAPTTFRNSKCNMCAGKAECYLHLYGLSTWVMGNAARPAVYSHPSAPGVVLGTGNVGPVGTGLGDSDGLCTWISRDGGVTWEDIAEGAHIYEFADWGGVVVMAQHEYSGPTDKIIFTMDYGSCWYTVPLETALNVNNIRVEPDGQRPRVLVHGSACSKDRNPKCSYEASDAHPVLQGLIYVVDVAELLGNTLQSCKPGLDFEEWGVPTETHSPACVLGAQRYYTRRKASSLCLQGANYQRPPARNTTCTCTYEDAECDYGFIRMAKDGNKCHPLPKGKLQTCPIIKDGTYTVSDTGLRLVHNDVCQGVDKIIPDTDGRGGAKGHHHPHKGGGGGGGSTPKPHGAAFGFFIFVMVVGAVSGIFAVWWKFLAGETAKAQVLEVVAPVLSFLESVWGWIVDKVTGRYSSLAAADNELNYFQPLGDAATADANGPNNSRFTL